MGDRKPGYIYYVCCGFDRNQAVMTAIRKPIKHKRSAVAIAPTHRDKRCLINDLLMENSEIHKIPGLRVINVLLYSFCFWTGFVQPYSG